VDNWTGNKQGWLNGIAKENKAVDTLSPGAKTNQTQVKEIVITHISLKCPYCDSKKIKCYGKDQNTKFTLKYYRCIPCKRKFKVIEREKPV
jgi:transposase-like protein